MTQFYHWLGAEAETYHDDWPEGLVGILPDDTPCPTQDELG